MRQSKARSVKLLAAATLVVLLSAPHLFADGMPSVECVKALRSANIERLNGNTLGQLEKLRSAQAPCEGGIAGIVAMLGFHRQTPLPDEEFASLTEKFVETTERPDFELSLGLAQQLVRDPSLGDDTLKRVLELLEAQVDRADRADRVDGGEVFADRDQASQTLRVLADGQARLGLMESYGSTLEKLYAIDQPPDVAWSLLEYHRGAENWDRALELVRSLAATNVHLETMVVRLLAKAGRREELMTELATLAENWAVPVGDPGTDSVADPAADPSGESETSEPKETRTVYFRGGENPESVTTPGAAVASDLLASRAVFAGLALSVAWDMRDQGFDDEAETAFRTVLRVFPQEPVASAALLHLYGSEADRQAYRAALEQKRAATTDPVELVNQGADLLAARNYPDAYAVLKRVVAEFQGDPMLDSEALWYNFAIAAYRTENWADAERGFDQALLSTERVQSLLFSGMAKVKLERFAEAVPKLERALSLDPSQKAAHYQLWVAHKALGNADAAAKHRAAYDSSQ